VVFSPWNLVEIPVTANIFSVLKTSFFMNQVDSDFLDGQQEIGAEAF